MRLALTIALGLFVVIIAGCSSSPAKEETAKMVEPPKEAHNVPPPLVPAQTKRELGSLWSESSRWNELYSVYTGRAVGDIVILKPTDAFKIQIAKAGGKSYDPTQLSRENTNIVAQIKEILPRQNYVVEAKQSVRVGIRDHRIELKARMREQDIGSDDSASTEQLFDVALNVQGEDTVEEKKVAAAEKAAATERKKEPVAADEKISDEVKVGGVKETKKETKK